MPASDSSPGPVVAAREFEAGGRKYVLRPLAPDDAPRLQDFFYSHTLETIQLRYGHVLTHMTSERAHDLVNVDQTRDLALAVFEAGAARQAIHAVGRYYVDPSGLSAEVAFVVRESLRRGGLGTRLMQTMVDVARSRGLQFLWGRVRRDNVPMLGLFRRFGGAPAPVSDAGDPDVEMRILLQAAARPATTADSARRKKGLRRPTLRKGRSRKQQA